MVRRFAPKALAALGAALAPIVLLAVGPARATTRPFAALSAPSDSTIHWPAGTEVLVFENLEGIVLLHGQLRGAARDTAGLLVLDTGAGHLALDAPLAVHLGILDRLPESTADVGFATRPLRRLQIGATQLDLVSPILTVDAEIVRRVTDRPVLGLLGQSLFRNMALWMDFREQTLALIPISPSSPAAEWKDRVAASRAALGGALGPRAIAAPFTLEGDGKIIVSVHLSDPRPPRWSRKLDLILDTGATKTVLFTGPLGRAVPGATRWRKLEGLSAPTLFGSESAAMAMVPAIELRVPGGRIRRDEMDAALLGGQLGPLLSRATGRTVFGLLGYSFLRHYRVCLDYPHRVLWLEPLVPAWDDRPFEYSHPGIQIERVSGAVSVVAVGRGSPAEEAGIVAGDEMVALNGEPVAGESVVVLARQLEGEPGSAVELVVRRAGRELRFRVVRRQLL